MSLRREGRCLAIAIAQLPKGGGIRAYAHFRSSLARWRVKARMGFCPMGVPWPPSVACARGVRVVGGLGSVTRLAFSLLRAARVDVLFGTVVRVAVGPSWRCGAVSSFAASRGPLGYHW